MPTKTKTAGSEPSSTATSLEAMFSEALALVDKKDFKKATEALEALQAEASRQGQVGMARSARNYLLAIKAQSEKKPEEPSRPELAAQLALNRGKADEALAVLEPALKAKPDDAKLLYLKASAYAQKDEAEAAAESLKKAVSLNQDFRHQFRMERDFDHVRSSAVFISLGLD
jgi:predicted Zn-dependent protease